MTPDDAARLEIERLGAELARLRELEKHLRDERERVRRETAAELQRLQAALKEAAARAGRGDEELVVRTRETADAGRRLAEREATVAAAEQRARALQSELDVERSRLAADRSRQSADRDRVRDELKRLEAERRRLLQESERLAEWERNLRLGAPASAPSATFADGLGRLAGTRAASRSPSGRSW